MLVNLLRLIETLRVPIEKKETWFVIVPSFCRGCGRNADIVHIRGKHNMTSSRHGLDYAFSYPLVCIDCMKRIHNVIKEESNTVTFRKNTSGYSDAPTTEVDENDSIGFTKI